MIPICDNAVSELKYQSKSWPEQIVLVTEKNLEGTMMVDVRKWYPHKTLPGGYRSSEKGICMKPEDWIAIIPLIQEMLANCQK